MNPSPQTAQAPVAADGVEAAGPGAVSAGQAYLHHAARLVERLAVEEWPAIERAAGAVADALAGGHTVHVFGTGHSHLLALESFYRAGGLAAVNPILVEPLMLHAGAAFSTAFERLKGLARVILDEHATTAGDVLIVASNSGGNAVVDEMARLARDRGLVVIGVTSVAHATSSHRRSDTESLHRSADIVIDNGGVVGDASVAVPGLDRRVAPTSTVVGAAIVNAVAAQAVALLVERGVEPEVFASSNTVGGDEINARLVERYRGRVRAL